MIHKIGLFDAQTNLIRWMHVEQNYFTWVCCHGFLATQWPLWCKHQLTTCFQGGDETITSLFLCDIYGYVWLHKQAKVMKEIHPSIR